MDQGIKVIKVRMSMIRRRIALLIGCVVLPICSQATGTPIIVNVPGAYYLESDSSDNSALVHACVPTADPGAMVNPSGAIAGLGCEPVAKVSLSDLDRFFEELTDRASKPENPEATAGLWLGAGGFMSAVVALLFWPKKIVVITAGGAFSLILEIVSLANGGGEHFSSIDNINGAILSLSSSEEHNFMTITTNGTDSGNDESERNEILSSFTEFINQYGYDPGLKVDVESKFSI